MMQQLTIPLDKPAARRRKVSKRVFRAIVHLRKQGQKVYRAGPKLFSIGGRIADIHELIRCAKSMGWQP